MKICPICQNTYADDSLNFCLSDGSVLNRVAPEQTSQSTVVIPSAPPTAGRRPDGQQPIAQQGQYQTPVQPVRKSRAWMWVVGSVLGLLLLIGLGFVGVVALAMIYGEPSAEPVNKGKTPAPNKPSKSGETLSDDFTGWRTEENAFGKTELVNGEFQMRSKGADYYYVLVTGNDGFLTSNATVKLALRNVSGKETKQGFGLLVHSDPGVALKRDYAFLIDTVKKSYRIVSHNNNKETELVKWTNFASIRGGSEPNEIQVRDESGKMTFYINGVEATSIKGSGGDYKEGVAGIYVSDAVPIAFTKMELSK